MVEVRWLAVIASLSVLVTSGLAVALPQGAGSAPVSTAPVPALPSAGGCPGANAIGNFAESSLVGASVHKAGSTWTYLFNSLVDLNSSNGVPGLIQYCVYPSVLPGSETVSAVGADGSAFTIAVGTHQGYFAFGRSNGDPSNLPLDGSIGVTMGTASWSGGLPTSESIVLHINDASECQGLYGGTSPTCFVYPAGTLHPVCGGAPVCKSLSATEALSTDPVTVPANTTLHLQYTFTVVNQPGNTFNMEFTPLSWSVPSNWTGVYDVFSCLQQVDPNATPSHYGGFPNYQGTGFNLLFTRSGNSTCQRPTITVANGGSAVFVLTPGQSFTFTVDLMSQPQGLCGSQGGYLMNFGVVLHWFQSNDSQLHIYHGPIVGISVA